MWYKVIVNDYKPSEQSLPSKEDPEKIRNEKFTPLKYSNRSNKSGIYAYSISPGKTQITIYFNSGEYYKYDIKSADDYEIKEMIRRAKNGWGLNRYLNKKKIRNFKKGEWK